MRLRIPLVGKILFWFFLNLLLLALVFYAFFKVQFQLDPESPLLGDSAKRIEVVGNLLSTEVRDLPVDKWNGVLERFKQAYGLDFYLFEGNGRQMAGKTVTLPKEVQEKMGSPALPDDNRPPFHEREDGPPPRRPPPPPPNGGSFDRDQDNPPGPPPRRAPEGMRNDGPPGQPPMDTVPSRFSVRTSDPTLYWVGIRVQLPSPRGPRIMPGLLIAVSKSMRGNGLFFDPKPWIIVAGAVILFSVLFWLPFVHSITRSLRQMTKATEQIADGRFEVELNDERSDELGRLGGAINHLAQRLSGYVTGQKRFMGDIAHELCSPIARIQMALGILEQRADEKQKGYVDDLREEVQQMSRLVNELLSFSKAGLKPLEIKLAPVNLAGLAREVAQREARPASPVTVEIPEDLQALAEPKLLSRALANIVRNAVRYAGQAGPIRIVASAQKASVVLSVIDGGPGVAEEMLDKIFEPFFRPDVARNAKTGGVGLGLAIVKTCMDACHGTVSARNIQPTGLQVDLRLRVPD
jgi:two-component system sensor histidine kinase CpxA